MSRVLNGLRTLLRLVILHGFYRHYARRRDRLPRVSWVIGPNDVASMATRIQEVIPGSFSYMKATHPFYTEGYDYCPSASETGMAKTWRLWVVEPALFARLAATAEGFLYLNELGYLNVYDDHRNFEFGFLKKRGVKIVCYFTGSDIRSPKMMAEHEQTTGLPNIASYLVYSDPVFRDPGFDEGRRAIAEVADRYADAIFSFPVDQRGYLRRASLPFQYFIPESRLNGDLSRFDPARPRAVVFHAPSSPLIKGTQLVRAAVEQLRGEGIDFDYVEMTDKPHEEIVAQLERSHIVLNQFYSHVPGMFGVEALAAGCVVMMSADERVETDLPAGSNAAWVVTRHWEVADKLRSLLQHPGEWKEQARAGQDWVRHNALSSVSGKKLLEILNSL